MKKETINKIEEEINRKTTLPNELKEKIKKEIFRNIIIAIATIIYFTFLIMGSVGTVKTVRSIDFNIFSIIILALSIYLFEIAYKKDNGKLAILGIETLVVAIITLFFPYIIFELDEFHKKHYMIISIYIAIYCIIKSIVIVNKEKKKHIKQTSDIKEIVKKEKRKDSTRIKEKSEIKEINKDTKKNDKVKNKAKIVTEEAASVPNKKEKNKKIESKDKIENTKKKETTKKTQKSQTENQSKIDSELEGELKPKKRGRPKKTETDNIKDKESKKTIEKEEIPATPKKRGRPRKVVAIDD